MHIVTCATVPRRAETSLRNKASEAHLEIGRSVIALEAEALQRLAALIDDNFTKAVQLILERGQRVIVSGIGKSGHVARKIAATLAATGTPSVFVHAAEAAHRDAGMVSPGDVLIVFSNSGATVEVQPLCIYAKVIGCPLIGISRNPNSLLMRTADIGLVLPKVEEACTASLAPTTSSTMMLALGDALAVAAMRARGMSGQDIRALHPGGDIGLQLRSVEDVMHHGTRLPLVKMSSRMPDVLITKTEKRLGIAGVVDHTGRLVGIISDGDLRRHAEALFAGTAADVMTAAPRTILRSASVQDALELMNTHRITVLFVVDERQPDVPIGAVQIYDIAAPLPDPGAGWPTVGRAVIIIPARLASTRFPAKPLTPLRGPDGVVRPALSYTREAGQAAALQLGGDTECVVATDDASIAAFANSAGMKVVMTPTGCINGTERCAAALEVVNEEFDLVINLQGDAPLTPANFISAISHKLFSDAQLSMATAAVSATVAVLQHLQSDAAAGRVGGTTVVCNRAGQALYFSKSNIPFVAPGASPLDNVLLHLGVYAYRPEALKAYAAMGPAILELQEGLEQLRFLNAGLPVGVCELASPPWEMIELNNPSDVPLIEAELIVRKRCEKN